MPLSFEIPEQLGAASGSSDTGLKPEESDSGSDAPRPPADTAEDIPVAPPNLNRQLSGTIYLGPGDLADQFQAEEGDEQALTFDDLHRSTRPVAIIGGHGGGASQ